MVWVCTRWWWSLGGLSGTGLVWSCLSSTTPTGLGSSFSFQSSGQPGSSHPWDLVIIMMMISRGGRKIQVWIHPGFTLPLFIIAFTIGQTEYLSEISCKMWGWNFPLLTHLVRVPLLTRFGSVRLRQKANSPKFWCKLVNFPMEQLITVEFWNWPGPFDKDGIRNVILRDYGTYLGLIFGTK